MFINIYLLAVPIGRNANEQNDLKDDHLPLENLNLDSSRLRIDIYTVRVFHPKLRFRYLQNFKVNLSMTAWCRRVVYSGLFPNVN